MEKVNEIKFKISRSNASTLFNNFEISIPDNDVYQPYNGAGIGYYYFSVSEDLIKKEQNEYIKKAMQDINSISRRIVKIEEHGIGQTNKNNQFCYDQLLLKFVDTKLIVKKLEIIFWGTYSSWKNNIDLEDEEMIIQTRINYEIDDNGNEIVSSADAILIGVSSSLPKDNPFCDMTIKYAYYYGANYYNALNNASLGESDLDFYKIYEPATCTTWKNVSELENEPEQRNVIYMLYDENKGHIYTGRADELVTRLRSHQNNPNDPIPGFTHYRFSKLQDNYYKYSYLIEDAAIHDMAWIFSMARSSHFHNSLEEEIKEGNIRGDMNNIQMVNSAECQPQIIDIK